MRAIFGRQLAAGHLPLWNPWVFSGIPFLGAMQTGMLYPTTWLFAVLPPTWAMNLLVIAIYACTALCTYAYTRGVGCSRFASVFAAVTFAFCGFCVVRIGSIPLLQGVAWLPLLLLALDRLRHRVRFRFVALGSIAAALAILTGHPQIPAYSLMVAVLYAAFFTAAGPAVGRARYASIATACLAAGVLLTAVQLAPAAELAMRSVRSHMTFDEFTSFSLPRAQLPILAFPFLFGGAAGTPYWGSWSLAEVTGYVGILPIMLAAAALGRWRIDLHARFWILLAALSLVLALGNGTPLAHFMYHVPIYSLFRGQARLLFVFSLAMAVLSAIATHARGQPAAVALDTCRRDKRGGRHRRLRPPRRPGRKTDLGKLRRGERLGWHPLPGLRSAPLLLEPGPLRHRRSSPSPAPPPCWRSTVARGAPESSPSRRCRRSICSCSRPGIPPPCLPPAAS